MVKKKLKSTGETVYILVPGEQRPSDGVCFNKDEWEWTEKLGNERHDPEEKQAFWSGIMEMKRANNNYSVFETFPRNKNDYICQEIIEMLRRGKSA